MANLSGAVRELNVLDELACGRTVIHRLHPFVKLAATLLFLVLVISCNRYEIGGLLPFFFYPVIVLALAEVPYRVIGTRMLVALPFSLFAGISNLIFDRAELFRLGSLVFSAGAVSFLSILLKTVLTVSAVLLFVAVTPMTQLAQELLRLHVPQIFVLQLTMTYRYLTVLAQEASTMVTAYLLRAPKENGVRMRDMGSFAGQLLLRSFDRAERVYQAMCCRGFAGVGMRVQKQKFAAADWVFLAGCTALLLTFRFVPLTSLLGGFLQ